MSNPYQGPPQPQRPPYQQVYSQQPPPRGASITSLVLGLVSILLGFTFLVPIVGFIFGVVGMRKEPAGRGMAIAGLVLNGIFLIGWVLLLVFVFGLFGLIATSATMG
ncbi:DUF4190 domain-containing protein [Arthrobacter pigmenti]